MKATIEIPDGYTLVKVCDTEYKVVKEENKLPYTWEEFCETHPLKRGEFGVDAEHELFEVIESEGCKRLTSWRLLLPNKEKAEAILALCQLIQLRDCYNDGWVPDWGNSEAKKHVISLIGNNWIETWRTKDACMFAFKSVDIRDKFHENFRYLLDKIKPLYQ